MYETPCMPAAAIEHPIKSSILLSSAPTSWAQSTGAAGYEHPTFDMEHSRVKKKKPQKRMHVPHAFWTMSKKKRTRGFERV